MNRLASWVDAALMWAFGGTLGNLLTALFVPLVVMGSLAFAARCSHLKTETREARCVETCGAGRVVRVTMRECVCAPLSMRP